MERLLMKNKRKGWREGWRGTEAVLQRLTDL